MSVLDRIKAANKSDRKSKMSKRSGQIAAQVPVIKRIANGTIPPKEA